MLSLQVILCILEEPERRRGKGDREERERMGEGREERKEGREKER